ncbi:MAG TPA: hypothetical protein VM802_07950 [Chitinophaga sp.]|uniref:hypothetical protein n=1 Tax=Chitinophaga sp. TaxID=1869181 RepID=UPI002BDA636B|nr:hypothetical protein [Chitinophaga sp.]HVI44787.1 hypothetical protein [Chitinophaga sp.]
MDIMNEFGLSRNPYVEIFKQIMPLLIAAVLLGLYYRKRIAAVDCVLYAFATEAYTAITLGPTFTATLFISVFFLLDELHQLFTGHVYISKPYLLLLVIPAVSSLVVFCIVQLFKDPFYYPPGKQPDFYFRPAYFYIKTYLPWFAVGAKIVKDASTYSFEQFGNTIRRITGFSFVIAMLQLFSQLVLKNVELGELLGLQSRYLILMPEESFGMRIQALFSEPKTYAAFLALAIPILLKKKDYWYVALAFIMGVLTVSQTFWINLLSAGLVFFVFPNILSVRLKVLSVLGMIVAIFISIAATKQFFMEKYNANKHNIVYQLVLKRSVYRYDKSVWQKDNEVLGIPLQRDLELPVVEFLRDEPYLLLSGYGPGNSTFIPAHYFWGQASYKYRLAGVGANNLNMRWLFILAEFGLLSLICFFVVMTRTKQDISPFQRKYFAFVWVCFFFSQIDLFMIIISLLSVYETNEPATGQL